MVAAVVLTIASMPVALAQDSAVTYRVTYKADASGSCLVLSGALDPLEPSVDYAVNGLGYITMVGEALAKGPIPSAIPGSDPFSYPTDPKTGTPIFPLAYVSDARELSEVSGIGSIFLNWTVNVTETHKLLLYLRPEPEPEMGAPLPFAGVFYPESDGLWIPIHYEGFDFETPTIISGEGVLISMGKIDHPDFPKGLSMIGVYLFIDGTTLMLTWFNQPTNLKVLNPSFPDKEIPAAVVFETKVELLKTEFSPNLYTVVVGVAMMAVIGVVVIKRRRANLHQSLT